MNTFLRCLNTFIKLIKLLIIDYFDAMIFIFYLFFINICILTTHLVAVGFFGNFKEKFQRRKHHLNL